MASSLSNTFRDGAMAKICSASSTRYKASFHSLTGSGSPPTVATSAWVAGTSLNELPASANYPAGGIALTSTLTATTMTFNDVVIPTGAAETIGPVSYILIYDTLDSNKVVAFLDYSASPKTASSTGTFTLDFPAAMITLSVS